MTWLLDPPATPALPVFGTDKHLGIRRIWCVGRNYAAHVKEMGGDPQRDPPFFFAKPADALLAAPDRGPIDLPYPPATADFHHEVELVVALRSGGRDLDAAAALACIAGYAVGLDMTRRDLQAAAKKAGQPWEMAKAFDHSAVCGALHLVADIGHPQAGRVALEVDGALRQQGDLRDLIWSVAEILGHLSRLVSLGAGDLIYTGTPEGVGPVVPGQRIDASIAGVGAISARVVA